MLVNYLILIDVVCLILLLFNVDCVVKWVVVCNLFMCGLVWVVGYIVNDDGVGLVDDCVVVVYVGGILVIFFEGICSVLG